MSDAVLWIGIVDDDICLSYYRYHTCSFRLPCSRIIDSPSQNNVLIYTQLHQDDDSGSDSDSASDWASSSSSSDDDSDSDAGAEQQLKGRAFWLKKTTIVKEKVVKDKEGRGEDRKKAKEEAARAKALAEATTITSTKTFLPEENLTPSLINKKTMEVVSSRGRKGTDNHVLLRQLEALSRLAVRFGPRVEIPVLMHVITAQFDLQRNIDDFMETPSWRSCAGYLSRIGAILDNDKEGWKIGVLTADEGDIANDLMISAVVGKTGGKMKAGAGKGGEGAMSAMAAEQQLINPHTVSSWLNSFFYHLLPMKDDVA